MLKLLMRERKRQREGEWVPTCPSCAKFIVKESSENINLSILLVLEIGIDRLLCFNFLFNFNF